MFQLEKFIIIIIINYYYYYYYYDYYYYYYNTLIMKNLTDFRKTVETGVDPRLKGESYPESHTRLLNTDTSLGQCALSLRKESPYTFSKFNLLNTDTFFFPLSVRINRI